LEFYQAYADYEDNMDLTEELFRELAQLVLGSTDVPYGDKVFHFGEPFVRLSVFDSILKYNPELTADDLRDHTSEVGGLSGSLVSIDTDAHGELYLVFLSGSILRVTTTTDSDRDGIDDAWASRFGMSGLDGAARGPFGDPDGDGLINAREFRRGSHPRGGRSPVSEKVPKGSSRRASAC